MKVKQISIFLENKSGRLNAVTNLLAEKGINIRALSIADTSAFGILRLIVNDPERAYKELKEAAFTVSLTDVLGVEMPDKPGGLAMVMDILTEAGINIEYLYAFISSDQGKAMVIFRVENLDEAIECLLKEGIRVVDGETLYKM
ncbi:MAG: ACT domain-containing protein [Bacillota bacterium]